MTETAVHAVLGMVVQRRCLKYLHTGQHEQHQGDESVTLDQLQQRSVGHRQGSVDWSRDKCPTLCCAL